MKVKELIEKLKQLDDDLEVVVRVFSEGEDYDSIDVEQCVSDGQDSAVIIYYA